MEEFSLIVGLGNPGKAYENTRHNIGMNVLKKLSSKYSIELKPSLQQVKGVLGKGLVLGKKVLLLFPLTYMNDSGLSVKKCVEAYTVPLSKVIVVADDIALEFGHLRLRAKGSSGGHNGLKSIEACLETKEWARLRLGVGDEREGDLADYVLGPFTVEEKQKLPEVIDRAALALEVWLSEGMEKAMREVNGCTI